MRNLLACIGRRARISGTIGLLLVALAGFAAPAQAASAAATPAAKSASHARQPGTVRPTVSPAQARALRMAAGRRAIAEATVPDTCSGAISPDTIYPCTTPSSGGTDTFTMTLSNATDALFIRVSPTRIGSGLLVTVTAPDGSTVSCQQPIQLDQCATNQAGTYTLAVSNEGSSYTVSYTALLSEADCPAIDPSFAGPTVQGTFAAGQTGACYALGMSAGSVLHANLLSDNGDLQVAIYDTTGSQVCVDDQGDCTLTGSGPYRVFASVLSGETEKYGLQLNNLTHPQGCADVAQQTYGQVPVSSPDRCRTLTVAKAGKYQISAVNAGFGSMFGAVYADDGTPACTNLLADCQLAAGTYNFIADSDWPPMVGFSVVFIAADESRGCAATGDTGFAAGPATGDFGGIGEEICLNLPTASGRADYFFDQPAGPSAPEAGMQVVDASGTQQCLDANGNFTYAACTLTGTAPFRVLLSPEAAHGMYRLLVQRTDSYAGCLAWPRSGFGGSFGATVTLTASSDVKCLKVPAGQHSTGEMIDYSNLANTVDGTLYVNDPSGRQVCAGASSSICSYKKTVNYTALMVLGAARDTFHLVRRDVSASAKCARPKSTVVGGPSTTFTLTSDLDTVCERVTASAADKLFFSVRALAPSPAGAVLQITNGSGAFVCRQFGNACRVTGSTDYQLLVTADNYAGIAVTTRLDTWLVGTGAGWVPQCGKHHLPAAGVWGPLSGTLTEKAAGFCAVLDIKPQQDFNIAGVDSAGYPDTPNVNVFTAADWAQVAPIGLCSGDFGQFGASCTPEFNQPATQAVLLLTSGNSPNPTTYTMQGICQTDCASPPKTATIDSVAPASASAGLNRRVVVHGAGLNMGTQFSLASDGSTVATGFTQSVNAAGTSITVLVNTSDLTPGTYDALLNSPGYAVGTPSPGYLPGAYTVTTAPPAAAPARFAPVGPARVLDTRRGLGARKGPVAGRGTITVKVTGAGGVPAGGVRAVALEVTALTPASGGNLIVYPAGARRPAVTDLSFGVRQTVTNLVVVPVVNGRVSFYNAAAGTLNLTADVVGYYAAGTSGTALTTVNPRRVLDTRSGLGAAKRRVRGGGTVTVKVAGAGVSAVALEVTAINPASGGSLIVYPAGARRPGVTDLSFPAKRTITSLVVVPVRDGKISLYNASRGTLDLAAAVTGDYSSGGAVFQPAGPMRILDTRTGLGGSGQTILPHAAAVTRVMNVPGIPGTVTAVVLNVTVTGAQRPGNLTAFPDGQPLPTAPSLTFAANQVASGLVIVPVVNGVIDFYNGSTGSIQVVADIQGYYQS